MKRLSATLQIAIALACLSTAVLLTAQLVGLVPDRRRTILDSRRALSEAIALDCSLFVRREDLASMEVSLRCTTQRNPELLSVGIRRQDGQLLVAAGEHPPLWQGGSTKSSDSHVVVPITSGGKPWGRVELRFQPLAAPGLWGYLEHPLVPLLLYCALASMFANWLYLRRVLQHLDPSKAIPGRVRNALDTLAEGLVVLDKDERIVMANKAFVETVGLSSDDLVGSRVSELPWTADRYARHSGELPWVRASQEGETQVGALLCLNSEEAGDSDQRTFKVNSTPILGDDGAHRGVLASFDEVTLLQRQMEELSELRDELIDTAREAGMAEIATNVLHNVGNVLNSVNVSAAALSENLKASRVSYLSDISKLLDQHGDDLGTFFTENEKGKRLPKFLDRLAEQTQAEREANLKELQSLVENVEHIKAIVTMQQTYVRVADVAEPCNLNKLMDDAIRFANIDREAKEIDLVREYGEVPEAVVIRGKLLQILVNLIRNASDAVLEANPPRKLITLRTTCAENDRVRLEVVDTGVGIPEANLAKMFTHGFTTKKTGHGFGLHSASLAASEMGGALNVHSAGPGKGATFTVELPTTIPDSTVEQPVETQTH